MIKEKKKLEDDYGEYVEMQPCLPPSSEVSKINLPKYLNVIDRVDIKAKMVELEMSRESAKEIARHYRDRCSKLQIKKLQIKNKQLEVKNLQIQVLGLCEKHKVHHLWRNQILEEQLRSGKILKLALS